MPSIPIIIDDVKRYGNFRMTRCTYFTIECDTLSPEWILELGELGIPFYPLGLSGIIWKPIGDKDIFDSIDLIDELFDAIEKNPSLYVDTNEIWLPNFLFRHPSNTTCHKRGSVYRVENDLFRTAYFFTSDRIPERDFLKTCEKNIERIRYSEEETKSFSEWEQTQISRAKQTYPKNSNLVLRWEEKNEDNHEK